jgi:protein-S-isoprenylcysteine O-methyltransferase Ste14
MSAFAGYVVLLGSGWMAFNQDSAVRFPWNLCWNELLAAMFAVQHSGMARHAFKTALNRYVTEGLERSLYVAASGILLLVLVLGWQPVAPGSEAIWRLPAAFSLVSLLGAVGVLLLTPYLAPATFLGFRQAWTGEANEKHDVLRIVGPYRWVRHPLMGCVLVFLWGHAVMPAELLLLSGTLTAYVLVGTFLEERDLRRRFGSAYREYACRVPALIPWRAPAPPAVYPLGEPPAPAANGFPLPQ